MRDRATFRPLRKPGPMTELDHIAIYLRDHAAECPDCGYDLKGCITNICPECGETFTISALRRGPRRPLTVAWFVGLAGFAAAALFCCAAFVLILLQWTPRRNNLMLDGFCICAACLIGALVAAFINWFNSRQSLVAHSAWKQWLVALFPWTLTFAGWLILY